MITMYRSSRNKLVDAMLKKRSRFGAVLFERQSNLKALIRYIARSVPSIISRTRTPAERRAYSCHSSASRLLP